MTESDESAWPSTEKQLKRMASEETGQLKSPGTQVILESSDGVRHYISRNDATRLGIVRRLLETFEADDLDCPLVRVPVLPKTQTLLMVLRLAREIAKNEGDPPKWKQTLHETPKQLLFDVADAANFLDVQSVIEAATDLMAEKIETMSVDQIRAYFGEPADLDSATLKQFRTLTRPFTT